MSLQLRRQIEEEMEREAEINRKIEIYKRKFLKEKGNSKYRIVSTRKEANAVIIYDRTNIKSCTLILNSEKDKEIDDCERSDRYTLVFLKNKNPRDTRLTTIGDMHKNVEQHKNKF